MELKNYKLIDYLIIPLLDDNITLEDVSDNSGFVGVYTQDINRPYLDNHIFLLYDSEVNTKESLDRFLKFRNLDTIYNRNYITINKHHYIVYTFTKVNNLNINKIINEGLCRNKIDAVNIYKFWKDLDPDTFNKLFYPRFIKSKKLQNILPEEDYYPYEPLRVI